MNDDFISSFILQVVEDVMDKNDGIERCLQDNFMCKVQGAVEDHFITKYVIFQNMAWVLYLFVFVLY